MNKLIAAVLVTGLFLAVFVGLGSLVFKTICH